MVTTPHPDDCEIGVGGTAAKWIRAGAKGVLVVCTNGDKGSDDPQMTSERLAAIRQEEQLAAADVMGFKEVVFLKHPDGGLEDSEHFRGDLVREIRRHKPDTVLTTDPNRRGFYQHRDHRMTGQVTMDAVFPYARDHLSFPEHKALGLAPHKVERIYLWGADEPDAFVEIADTIEVKIKALAKHVSQVGPAKGRDFRNFIKENSKKAGEEHGVEYAERFRIIELRR